jgi:predicted ribosome quality control (RQC) complex YloA/Tae2 family protein
MDSRLLERLAAEAAARCAGARIRGVLARPEAGLTLLFEAAGVPALDLAPRLAGGHLAATRVRLAADPGGVATPLTAALCGGHLAGVQVLPGERIALLALAGGGGLILEILGGAGNIYLLDAGGVVQQRLRESGRPGGALAPGAIWRPPPPPGKADEAHAGADTAPPETPCWSPPGALPSQPGLAVPCLEEDLDPLAPWPGPPPAPRADGPQPGDGAFVATSLLGDAVVRRALWLARRQDAAGRLAQVRRRLAGEEKRLPRLQAALQAESQAAAAHGLLRRQAEAILAGLAVARREGSRLQVPDPYDAQAAWLEIELSPRTSPQDEAARLFRRAGRLARAAAQVQAKAEQARQRLAAVTLLAAQGAAVTTSVGLTALEEALPDWLRAPRSRAGGGEPPAPGRKLSTRLRRLQRDPRARQVKRYTLDGEWHVLVGGGAAANDFLTFRLAAPHDFWLHVADYAGAHVVVRNPSRRPDLPQSVLLRAAALAAHFSKAPGDGGAVAVRWTQARHVRKGRGLPVGAVLLPRASTLRVQPAPPPTAGPQAP